MKIHSFTVDFPLAPNGADHMIMAAELEQDSKLQKAIDEGFERLLEDIFGVDIMTAFRRKRPAGYIDLMIAFESRKRSCSPHKLYPLNVALPFSFIDFYKKCKGKDVSNS